MKRQDHTAAPDKGGPSKDRSDLSEHMSPPSWRFWLLYIGMTLMVLWFWQETFQGIAIQTIPYSEFKMHLSNGEVVEVMMDETEVTGRILPKTTKSKAETSAKKTNGPSLNQTVGPKLAADGSYMFRTVRIEDPELTKQLLAAHVKVSGTRPSLFSKFFWSWIIPIGLVFLLWSFLFRKMGRAGESVFTPGILLIHLKQKPC